MVIFGSLTDLRFMVDYCSGDGWRSSDGMTSSPRERSSSVDSRFARLVTSQQFPVQPESIRRYSFLL